SMVGSINCRNQRNEPTINPTPIPITIDKTIPAIRRSTEGKTSDISRGQVQVVVKALPICSQVGTKKLVVCDDHSTQARIKMIGRDRKSTRLNSSHVSISYAVFC